MCESGGKRYGWLVGFVVSRPAADDGGGEKRARETTLFAFVSCRYFVYCSSAHDNRFAGREMVRSQGGSKRENM